MIINQRVIDLKALIIDIYFSLIFNQRFQESKIKIRKAFNCKV